MSNARFWLNSVHCSQKGDQLCMTFIPFSLWRHYGFYVVNISLSEVRCQRALWQYTNLCLVSNDIHPLRRWVWMEQLKYYCRKSNIGYEGWPREGEWGEISKDCSAYHRMFRSKLYSFNPISITLIYCIYSFWLTIPCIPKPIQKVYLI